MIQTALRLAATASLLAITLPARAQEAPLAADGAETGEDIVIEAQRENATEVTRGGNVGALGDKAAEDVPFSIKSYNAALIYNQQPLTLGAVLENDPSVRTTYGFGNAAEQFVIRGFELFGDDVGLDGLYGITPRQLIAPELYDSVQVLNGASAFLNGAAPGGSGIGGSVNLIPKRAGADPLTRLTGTYLSDEHFGGSFDVARRFGAGSAWGVRVNGVARSGDVAINDEYRNAYLLGGSIDYDQGPLRVSLDLGYQSVRVERLRPKVTIGGAVPDVPEADVNYGQPWSFTELRDIFGQLKLEYDLAENAMLYAAIGARDGSEEGLYGGIRVDDPVSGAATISSSFIPRTDNNEAAQAGLRVRLAAGGISHEINVGGSASWQVNRNAYEFYASSLVPDSNIYDPVDVPAGTVVTFAGGDLDDPYPIERRRLWSAFASDTIGLWDDRILITGGLRLQTINLRSYSAFGGAQLGEYDESQVTPVVGVVIKPATGVSLFANRIEALVQGDSAPVAGPSGQPVTNGGSVLPPYASIQYEVGGKLAIGRIDASLALFQTDRKRGILTPDPEVEGALVFGPFGIQRNRGVELSVDGELAEGLRLIAGGSIVDAKLRQTQDGVNQGLQAVGVPEYTANANLEWDLRFAPGLTLTGRVVHTGEQMANVANSLVLPDWTRFDLGARYVALVADRPLTLRFGVDNVANERYWSSAFTTFTFQSDLLQGAPRTFRASASIDF